MKITVLHNQSLLDVSLQHTGKVENAFDIAVANGISITDDLIVGGGLNVSHDTTKNNDILNYYTAKNIQPATAITQKFEMDMTMEGIDYWAIQYDFVVQ